MGNSFDSLLKTHNSSVEPIKQTGEVLARSKLKIKNICKALCLPGLQYDPSRTISSLIKYIEETDTNGRVLYSEISSYVYKFSSDDEGNFSTNIEYLLSYVLDESNCVDREMIGIVIKIYDHFQLAIHQKNLNTETKEITKKQLVESLDEAKKAVEQSAENAKRMEKEYITILGIFASIVIAFMGGLSFSSMVLENFQKGNVYRVIFVIILLALVLISIIHLLAKFIASINDKGWVLPEICNYSMVFLILIGAVIIAWVIDIGKLVECFRKLLPWIN